MDDGFSGGVVPNPEKLVSVLEAFRIEMQVALDRFHHCCCLDYLWLGSSVHCCEAYTTNFYLYLDKQHLFSCQSYLVDSSTHINISICSFFPVA